MDVESLLGVLHCLNVPFSCFCGAEIESLFRHSFIWKGDCRMESVMLLSLHGLRIRLDI